MEIPIFFFVLLRKNAVLFRKGDIAGGFFLKQMFFDTCQSVNIEHTHSPPVHDHRRKHLLLFSVARFIR